MRKSPVKILSEKPTLKVGLITFLLSLFDLVQDKGRKEDSKAYEIHIFFNASLIS